MLSVTGCAATPPPTSKQPARTPSPAVQTASEEASPLTPPPPAVPDLLMEVDFQRLLAAITAGTNVKLDALMLAASWQIPGLTLDRPVVLGKTGSSDAMPVILSGVKPGTRPEFDAADAELEARGLKLLKGGACAFREGGGGGSVLCGARPEMLAFADALLARQGALPAEQALRVSVRLGRSLAGGLYELRAEIPRAVDPLLPDGSTLGKAPGLRLGLMDFAFELSGKLVDGYEKLGPLDVTVSAEHAGQLTISAALEPEKGSTFARAIEAAKPPRIPPAFWELSEHTDSALFFDGSLLTPLIEPSPRTLALLADSRDSLGFVDELNAARSTCLQAGQALVLTRGRKRRAPESGAKPGPPELKKFPPPPPESSPGHLLLGIEDAKGACGKALRALLASHERRGAVPGDAEAKRHLSTVPTPKPLPASVRILKWGTSEPTYVALSERRGVAWLGASSDLATLEAALVDLLAPAPKRRGLRARPELSDMGKAPALMHGFIREDALPFADPLRDHPAAALRDPLAREAGVGRVPFAIVRENTGARLSSQIEARSLRRVFAQTIGEAWARAGFAQLAEKPKQAALDILEASCKLGHGDSCNVLGVAYGDGHGVPVDSARAAKLLEQGCEQKSGMACANLAFYKKVDKAEELALFRKSCGLDAAFGCGWWGVRLVDSDKASDQQLGFEKLTAGCDGFVGFACARIGSHYQEGIGLAKDEAKGADFHERSCQLRFGSGCVALADAFSSGKGRSKNLQESFRTLKRACVLETGEGCYALGLAYLNGEGTAKDEAAAHQQFSAACEAEHAEACRMLAEMAGEP